MALNPRRAGLFRLLTGASLLLSCAAPHEAAAPGVRTPNAEASPAVARGSVVGRRAGQDGAAPRPPTLELTRTVVTPGGSFDISDLFREAEGQLDAKQYARAAVSFERVLVLDPRGPFAEAALFNAAAAHDDAGQFELSQARYEEFASRFSTSPHLREVLVRTIRLAAYLNRFQRAGEVADHLLEQSETLRPFETIVVRSGKALALVELGDVSGAEYHVEKARDVIETQRLDQAGKIPRDLAQAYFALGELRRLKGEQIRFKPMPERFGVELERRCQLLLDAQSAYSDAMRAYDAHWSAMAGFRVGELYQRLHADLMDTPLHERARTREEQRLLEGAMRLRYSILLRKGLTMLEHTLKMAERTGEASEWVLRTRKAKLEVERALKEEDRAMARLPYTRVQLQEALDELGRRAASGGGVGEGGEGRAP